MTRDEFDAIRSRASKAMTLCAADALTDLHAVMAGTYVPEDLPGMLRRGRLALARMHAAYDQYEAASRCVPRDWLPVSERGS
jgi:hypothetical protein